MIYHILMIHDDLWWSIMIYHDLSWSIMIYHDLSWSIMIYHDLEPPNFSYPEKCDKMLQVYQVWGKNTPFLWIQTEGLGILCIKSDLNHPQHTQTMSKPSQHQLQHFFLCTPQQQQRLLPLLWCLAGAERNTIGPDIRLQPPTSGDGGMGGWRDGIRIDPDPKFISTSCTFDTYECWWTALKIPLWSLPAPRIVSFVAVRWL